VLQVEKKIHATKVLMFGEDQNPLLKIVAAELRVIMEKDYDMQIKKTQKSLEITNRMVVSVKEVCK